MQNVSSSLAWEPGISHLPCVCCLLPGLPLLWLRYSYGWLELLETWVPVLKRKSAAFHCFWCLQRKATFFLVVDSCRWLSGEGYPDWSVQVKRWCGKWSPVEQRHCGWFLRATAQQNPYLVCLFLCLWAVFYWLKSGLPISSVSGGASFTSPLEERLCSQCTRAMTVRVQAREWITCCLQEHKPCTFAYFSR